MKRIYLVSYLLVAVFTLSCKAVDYSETPPAPDSQFVTADDQLLIDRGLKVLQLSDAERVAQRFMLKDTKKMFSVSAATRADHLTAVRDSAGNPVMYVVNFEQGGFCIVSATKKAYPILAHSDEGFFDLEKVGQSGVCIWLDEMVYGITHRDTLSEEERIFVNSAWAEYESRNYSADTRAFDFNDPRYKAFIDRMNSHYDADARDGQPLYYMQGELPAEVYSHFHSIASSYGCPDEYAIVETIDQSTYEKAGPRLTTHWHQGDPYNRSVPNRYPAGCYAIAVGQIMKYYQHPSYFDWASMNDPYGKINAADFIYNVGRKIGTTYTSGGSSAYTGPTKVALERDFGYKVELGTLYDPNFNVQDRLRRHGVVGTGGNTETGAGHAWVYDGYTSRHEAKKYLLECQIYKNGEYIYVTDSRGNYLYNSPYTFYETHTNWGWGASYDGWYGGEPTQARGSESNYKYHRDFFVMTPVR